MWKIISQTIDHAQFKSLLNKDTHAFGGHVNRISTEFREQKYLKETIAENHVYIHMGVAED